MDGRFDEAHVLLEMSRELTSSLELEHVLRGTLKTVGKLVEFNCASIQLVEEGLLRLAAADPPWEEEDRTVPVGETVCGSVAASGRPFYSPDVRADPEVGARGGMAWVRAEAVSYFGAPLELQGRCIGVLQVDSSDTDAFAPEQQAGVMSCTPLIAAAVHNALTFRSEHEKLTRLEEAARTKRDFVTIVSHELRTPLAVIMGFASAIADNAGSLEAQRISDLSRKIIDSGRRLDRLIGDLLDLSRIERGVFRVELEEVSLPQLLEAAGLTATGMRPVEVDLEPDLPLLLADERRLHQVVDNLVANASKFSPSSERVLLSARRAGADRVTIAVSDRGPGMPAEVQARVFEPFFQAGEEKSPGMGLGLYLVREITEAMAGTVEIDSHPGRGTTVSVTFPVVSR